ncbi:MAG: efflux RND transporter permease subunit [Desulfobacterales bacterium]|nr:efflux RND transporter permease subunit [Desulfobacterales bacterium]MDD4392815.1 efflux RND transporter permease subunit [Desulfobacterales bacterium]
MKQTDNNDISRGPIAWMAGNSVAANLVMIVLFVGGLIFGIQMKQEVFPEFDTDSVTVTVSYPGASPEEVEQAIILAIEEAVQGLDGVKEISSSSSEGSGVVTVEMLVGEDIQKLAQDVQSEVDRITTFPEEAEQPQVEIATHRRDVVSLALYGDQNERVLRETAEQIRDGLLQDPGITQVELDGVRDFEIRIEVPQANLRTYNLTLEDIADRVKNASVELPGGSLKTEGGEILVRMKERRDYGREFARIPIITTSDGTQVRLEDIATIIDGFEDSDRFATYNGKPAVMLDVYRVGDQTPISVSTAVHDYIKQYRHTMPPGLEVATQNDKSEVYRQRAELLLGNGFLGLILVFILLGLFLEARLAFWVAMGIPTSFLGALLFLPFMDVSINMMSMFAFIVALGIVVDDAIVVGENVYFYRQQGHSYMRASILGVREVAMPVVFSILTNVVAFMPLYFVPGIPGKMFRTIPVVVITVFLISLVESLFVLPAHLGHQKKRSPRGVFGWLHRGQQRFSNGFSRMIQQVYAPFLEKTLAWRYLTLAIGLVALLVALAYVKSGRIGTALFPRIESDFAYAEAVLPYGSSVVKTGAVQNQLVEAAMRVASENGGDLLVKGIYAQIGGSSRILGTSGGHVASIRVYLTASDVRPVQTGDFINQWRNETGDIPGLENLAFRSDIGGPGSGAALTVELSHRDLDMLKTAGEDLAKALDYFPNVKDIYDGFAIGKQQLDFVIRPEGRALGLTAREVASQVRNSFYGAEALRQQRGRNELTVRVRLPENERVSEYHLEQLMIRTPGGVDVLLRDVVDISRGHAYTEINRRAGRRVITVSADVDPPSQAERVISSLKSDALPDLINRHYGLRYSFEGHQAEMRDSMTSLGLGLCMALLAMYGLLAVPFRSYTQPAIVMICIPFGMVGALLGHLLMGYSLSVMSMFGVVALSGVVVNDSLVLIDFANRRRQGGDSAVAAIHAAGIQRFRPILLTTLTTFGGLAPMIMETSRQARFLIPMAISLGFGVLFATLITLVLVPSLYLIVEDVHQLAGVPQHSVQKPSGI